MREDLPRQLDSSTHEHRGPVDAVEPRDVFADHMHIGRPPFLETTLVGAEANPRHIVDQRVEPNVDRVVGVPRPWHAPLEAAPAGNADVPQAAVQPS